MGPQKNFAWHSSVVFTASQLDPALDPELPGIRNGCLKKGELETKTLVPIGCFLQTREGLQILSQTILKRQAS